MFVQKALSRVNSFRFNDVPPYPPNILLPEDESIFLDPTDLSSMYQNIDGTNPVTGSNQPVGFMVDKSAMPQQQTVAEYMALNGYSDPTQIPGNHMVADANDATRPVYIDTGSEKYLQFATTQYLTNSTFGGIQVDPNQPSIQGILWHWTVFLAIGVNSGPTGQQQHVCSMSDTTFDNSPHIHVVGSPANDYTLAIPDEFSNLTPYVSGELTTPKVVTLEHYSDLGCRGYQNGLFNCEIVPFFDRTEFRQGFALGKSGIDTSIGEGFDGRIYSLFAIRRVANATQRLFVEAWMIDLPGMPGLGELAVAEWHPSLLFVEEENEGGVYEPWLHSYNFYQVAPWAEPVGVGDLVQTIVDQSGNRNDLVAPPGRQGVLDYVPPSAGVDLVVNGHFDSQTLAPDWVPGVNAGSMTAVVQNHRIEVSNSGGAIGSFVHAVTVIPDRKYNISAIGFPGVSTSNVDISISTNATALGQAPDRQEDFGDERWFRTNDYMATQRTIYIHLHCDAGSTAVYDQIVVEDVETQKPNYVINFEGNQFYESRNSVRFDGNYYIAGAARSFDDDGLTSEIFTYSERDQPSELSLGIYKDPGIANDFYNNRVRYRTQGFDSQLNGFEMSLDPHIIGIQRNGNNDTRFRVDGAERQRLTSVLAAPSTNPRPVGVGEHNNEGGSRMRWSALVCVNKAIPDADARNVDVWLGNRAAVPLIDESYQPHLLFDSDSDGTPEVNGGLYDLYDRSSVLFFDDVSQYSQANTGQAVQVVLDKRHMQGQDAATWVAANAPPYPPTSASIGSIPGNHLQAVAVGGRPTMQASSLVPNETWLSFDGGDEIEVDVSAPQMGNRVTISTGLGNESADTNVSLHADSQDNNKYTLSFQAGDSALISANAGTAIQYAVDRQAVGITTRQELWDITGARRSALMAYDVDMQTAQWSGFGVSNGFPVALTDKILLEGQAPGGDYILLEGEAPDGDGIIQEIGT